MKKLSNIMKDESGQMAILVMLVLVVALTIGLSVITRTVTDIRLSTDTNQSQQAYAAAEAGVEEALRSGSITGSPVPVASGNNASKLTVTTTTQGASSTAFAFANPLSKDESSQLWLFNYDYYKTNNNFPPLGNASPYYFNEGAARTLTIYWGSGTAGTAPTAPDYTTPALEASLIYKNGSTFGIDKFAVDPSSSRANNATSGNNFENPSTSGTTLQLGSPTFAVTTSQGAKNFYYRYNIPLASGGASSKLYLLLRLKLLYNDKAAGGTAHEVAIDPNGGNLPAQGQVIESKGEAGDTVRKIKVYQSYPSLPEVFDFVLFNGSATTPLSK